MDNSSRGSNVSLTESEQSVGSKESSTWSFGNKSQTHKYNTRYSARLAAGPQLKTLYVDLSHCKVDADREPHPHQAFVPQNWELARRRRESTSSEDSREFDFDRCAYSKSLELSRKVMDEVNPCDPARRRSHWLKYFVLINITSILYIYIQVIHSSDSMRKITKEIDRMKTNIEDSKFTLLKIERAVINMRREQEKQHSGLKNVISQEIEKYSADKTGKTDFALESTGGKIIKLSPGTENVEQAVTFLGMILCDGKHGPRAMIQADMSPGNCWAIKGSSGGAVIKLLAPVRIDSVSLEHISTSLSPTGEVSSAPSSFSVWGLNHQDDRGLLLGSFAYDLRGPLVQIYPIINSKVYEYVEFRVLTNQGHPEFTCIYRFRVHGQMAK